MKYYTYNNKTMNLTDWCKELNINYSTTANRLTKGQSFEEAINNKKMYNGHLFTYKGETDCMAGWCKKLNLKVSAIHSRVRKNPNASFEDIFFKPIRKRTVNIPVKVGDIYGSLQVISFSHRDKKYYDHYHCKCLACGTGKIVLGQNLRAGHSHSCGCQSGGSKDNPRRCHFYDYNGESHTLRQWSKILNINFGTLRSRRSLGMRGEQLFKTPYYGCTARIKLTYNNETLSLPQWAKKIGIPLGTIRWRLLAGHTTENILYRGTLKRYTKKNEIRTENTCSAN